MEVLFEHQLLVIVGVDVVSPFDWLGGATEGFEDVLVKLVLAHEEFLDALEEKSRFGALNDAVVVRRGHCHDLRHA
ncbi:unannotated protein [freshwater metagenome]|uniref:Unannotated protein n=1 Tax=freshwater metagenome TaxID=449393 RepID=A0A6J6JE41_9ZZZZ